MLRRHLLRALPLGVLAWSLPAAAADDLPLADAHIHYSHDAWTVISPADAVAALRKAGLRRALVSSSDDDGNQKLVAVAPDLIWPSLRPYRSRADTTSWTREPAIIGYLEDRLSRFRYVAIGEFHVYGADADLPVVRRMVELARQHQLVLHAHGDADAIGRLFAQWPAARILWAHSGFDRPEAVRDMLRKHRALWSDLAFRSEHGASGRVPPEWREAFAEFPDRFMIGTDTFTPERWFYVEEHARWTRAWLADLPRELAERIAWRNAEDLFGHYVPRPTQ
jgi:hypothetical protein